MDQIKEDTTNPTLFMCSQILHAFSPYNLYSSKFRDDRKFSHCIDIHNFFLSVCSTYERCLSLQS